MRGTAYSEKRGCLLILVKSVSQSVSQSINQSVSQSQITVIIMIFHFACTKLNERFNHFLDVLPSTDIFEIHRPLVPIHMRGRWQHASGLLTRLGWQQLHKMSLSVESLPIVSQWMWHCKWRLQWAVLSDSNPISLKLFFGRAQLMKVSARCQ